MTNPRLDLADLEVEHLDVVVTRLGGGVETLGTSNGSTELGHSCTGDDCNPNACTYFCDCNTSCSSNCGT